jgi:hypothetical protein
MSYSYQCKDYPGMEACPASFTTETEQELWKHIELHGSAAHGENLRSGRRKIESRSRSSYAEVLATLGDWDQGTVR